jgi:tyrosine ammonia-lyase
MTGIAALNAFDAIRAADTGLHLAILNAEIFCARHEAWDELLGDLRPHPGQSLIHRQLTDVVESSARLRGPDERSASDGYDVPDDQPLQDRYSIRCVPQIFGAILDELHHHNRIAATELNSVTDNPIVDPDGDRAVHGGNFYGQHVAFASDHLASAALKLAIQGEAIVSRLCDPKDNHQLPPFLQPNEPGLRSGFMGAQVTATSLVAEMRTHSTPAATQSISTNADNQDVVPMGTTAARRASDHLDHLWDLLAIEALALTQAFELSDGFDSGDFCDASRTLADEVRDISPTLIEDRALAPDIRRVQQHLRTRSAQLPSHPPPARSDAGESS